MGFVKLFGSRNDRLIKRMKRRVAEINRLEPVYAEMTDTALSFQTKLLSHQYYEGKDLDDLLPKAFAVVREASKRVLGLRHYDVQLMGGMVIHAGQIAEMCTGEGKTLMATLAVYLNALTGYGVHVVTVNPYLAERDAAWMEPLYDFLGLTVATLLPQTPLEERKLAYEADVLYATNNEVGFDYLRDNMVFSLDDRVQKPLFFAIVDEVDSILIDEARTPLIISGEAEESSALYQAIHTHCQLLEVGDDMSVDEKERQVHLTDAGHRRLEEQLRSGGLLPQDATLYDVAHISLLYYAQAALRALHCFQRDVDYLIQEGQVVIIDEHTGRAMPGRRWSDGLHQAIEAKEGLQIQQESQTLASITFQNYFRMYRKLAGMTGTADTEAFEFQEIYGLEVVVIPTHKPLARMDHKDRFYMDERQKLDAIVADVKERHERGQPILMGTVSVERSEKLSQRLKEAGLKHEVLNAKHHAREAQIIAQAGAPGAITIATNMAGRGTDIVLGGHLDRALQEARKADRAAIQAQWEADHQAVLEAGGLHVLGTERHESRRIDNQLRGRSGRQGDPGSSQFYLSFEDDLMRIFASDRVKRMIQSLGPEEVLEAKMLNRAIETAQKRVEGFNFDMRKNLLKYDDVANQQRQLVYQLRMDIMNTEDATETLMDMMTTVVKHWVDRCLPEADLDTPWDALGLEQMAEREWGLEAPVTQWLDVEHLDRGMVAQRLLDGVHQRYRERSAAWGPSVKAELERLVLLQTLDKQWKDHLQSLDHLRQGIHLRGFAQKNPTDEFKREAFELFEDMLMAVKRLVVIQLLNVEVRSESEVTSRSDDLREQALPAQALARSKHIGRNDPCPCGSGKKYKRCCGAL